MPNEKLEFSLEDLGRLAAFLDTWEAAPVDGVVQWLRIHTDDLSTTLREWDSVCDRVHSGYAVKMD